MTRAPTFRIGLTGNIGSGKSTVGGMLASLGAQVIDADLVAHEVMRSGTPVFSALVEAFTTKVVGADGEIDRARLAAIVFSDSSALDKLEAIVHPATIQAIEQRIAVSRTPVVVIEAVKLIEAGIADGCDSVWVVTSNPEQQVARAVARGMDQTEAERRIRAQSSQEQKLARADIAIDNSGTRCATRAQVEAAWERLSLSGSAGRSYALAADSVPGIIE